ncbi:MAG TPA: stress response translation initiation inhibitor YciH [Gammaproteobacteria bacterium]|nr:stress response translation initiation inhibitor YciH [Gammaproteobacteria bacterium]
MKPPQKQPSKPQARPSAASSAPDDGVVRIFREKGGRGGKTVTVIRGLPERGPALEARAQELKRLVGAGGALKDGAIEIQGDHRERISQRLEALGYKVKLAGG